MSFATIQLITHPRNKPVLKLVNGVHECGCVQLLTPEGCPIDLTDYDTTRNIQSDDNEPVKRPRILPVTRGIVLAVSQYYGQCRPDLIKVCRVEGDPKDGEVYIEIEPNDLRWPGLYMANILLCSEGEGKQSFDLYLESSPTVAWQYQAQGFPVTIAEIRLWARDWQDCNSLLDEVEYSDAEVAAAIRRPIDLFNGEPPLLRRFIYSTVTFPANFRSSWVDCSLGFLEQLAGTWYSRQHLQYQAGGISVDDRNKYVEYWKRGQERIDKYMVWLKNTKAQLNASQCVARTGYFSIG
jgi:hypothetical protein